MINTDDQKLAFEQRVKRIGAGKQFEHADVIGRQTQAEWKRRHGTKSKRPPRSFAEKLMVLVAFFCGAGAVLLGRLIYFQMSKITGLPEAFYDLGNRGMMLFALIVAMMLILMFQLFTRGRLQSLALGCLLMHFGEAAVAQQAPQFWAEFFPADYVAAVAGADTPAG